MPNASLQLLPEAGATRRLKAVRCKTLILIEVPSSAYLSGRLLVGKVTKKEETPCDATPNSIRRPVASLCMPAPCLFAS
jgi:hypothetical protein